VPGGFLFKDFSQQFVGLHGATMVTRRKIGKPEASGLAYKIAVKL